MQSATSGKKPGEVSLLVAIRRMYGIVQDGRLKVGVTKAGWERERLSFLLWITNTTCRLEIWQRLVNRTEGKMGEKGPLILDPKQKQQLWTVQEQGARSKEQGATEHSDLSTWAKSGGPKVELQGRHIRSRQPWNPV